MALASYPRTESLEYTFEYAAILHSYVTGGALRSTPNRLATNTFLLR